MQDSYKVIQYIIFHIICTCWTFLKLIKGLNKDIYLRITNKLSLEHLTLKDRLGISHNKKTDFSVAVNGFNHVVV